MAIDIQSVSLSVPTARCVNNCAYCVSCEHDSPYQDRITPAIAKACNADGRIPTDPKLWPRALRDYYKRLVFVRDNGTNFMVLTGAGEILQNKRHLQIGRAHV